MKKIYLVRHGETNHNAEGIVQGSDSVLSARGEQQAIVLASRLKTLAFEHLLVSDYVRTKQTILPLLQCSTVIPEYTPLLRETKQPTELIGISNSSEEFLTYYKNMSDNISNPEWRFSDEETFYDVVKRVKDFLQYAENKAGDVLAVSHGRFIIYVVMYIITEGKLDYETWLSTRHGFQTSNTGITVLEFSERYNSWKLLTFNDQAHFAE